MLTAVAHSLWVGNAMQGGNTPRTSAVGPAVSLHESLPYAVEPCTATCTTTSAHTCGFVPTGSCTPSRQQTVPAASHLPSCHLPAAVVPLLQQADLPFESSPHPPSLPLEACDVEALHPSIPVGLVPLPPRADLQSAQREGTARLHGMGWNGMEWDEMGWNGMEWDGMECDEELSGAWIRQPRAMPLPKKEPQRQEIAFC